MNDRKILATGVAGSVTAVICCFTPFLVVAFGVLALPALMGWWLDYLVLFPALAFFLGLTGYAVYRLSRKNDAEHVATTDTT